MRVARLDLNTPHELAAKFIFTVTNAETGEPEDLTGQDAILLIRGPGREETTLYDSTGLGTVTVAANVITVNIPFSGDYANILPTDSVGAYTWSLTGNDDWRLQGWWKSLEDTGPIDDTGNEISVRVGDTIVSVSLQSAESVGGDQTLEEVRALDNQIEGDIDFNGNTAADILKASFILTDPGDAVQGEMKWGSEQESFVFGVDGVSVPLNQPFWHIRNDTGDTLIKGTPVYASGTIGASGRITVDKMIADGSVPARLFLGALIADVVNGADGIAVTLADLRKFDSTGQGCEAWADGDVLYVSDTVAGQYTNVQPVAPNLKLPTAFIVYSHAVSGSIAIRVEQRTGLGGLHNVHNVSMQDQDGLFWSAVNSRWENRAATSNDISDFFTSVRATILTGLNTGLTGAVTATDTVLQAFGRLQNSIETGIHWTRVAGALYPKVLADKLGIGTDAPTAKVHVKADSSDSSSFGFQIDDSLGRTILSLRADGVALIGYYAGYSNTGSGFGSIQGYLAGYSNTGSGFGSIQGFRAGQNNNGSYFGSIQGSYAGQYNTGSNFGGIQGRFTGRYNVSDGLTAIGHETHSEFHEDTSNQKDFIPINVDTLLNRITITGHGFTSTSGYFLFKLTSTDTLPAPFAAGTVYQFKIIDVNTLEYATGNQVASITTQGVGTHTIIPAKKFNNCYLLGNGIEPEKPNQNIYGNSLTTEHKFNGNVIATGSAQVADDTDVASVDKVGALRYRADANNSYVDICVQTGAATYAWRTINKETW